MSRTDSQGTCRVCGSVDLVSLYESPGDCSFTSSQTSLPLKLSVAFCRSCAHAQTPPLPNITEYYDTAYNFRNRDAEEDDIYRVDEGEIVFRAAHQARVIEQKIDLSNVVRILDYGCGKASSLRKLTERHPSVIPYAFDVSESYVEAWDQFISKPNQATYAIPEKWIGQIDVVLSLFSLEHVEDPRGFVQTLKALLRTNGRVHLVVPHLYRNASDLLVADHINHFSASSMTRLFHDAGFKGIEIDTESHRAALVVSATLDSRAAITALPSDVNIADTAQKAEAIAANWSASATRISGFEAGKRRGKVAIYGSGVYGLFIATTLESLENVAYFLDMNPYRQGLILMNRPVIAPRAIEDDVETVLVGLNPVDAKQIIGQSPWLHAVSRNFVYL
jgi:SAM-dependent methyltransferase